MKRRGFLYGMSALSAAGALGVRDAAAEPPPEIKQIRLVHAPAICLAPMYLAEELLRLEGFSEIEYAEMKTGFPAQMVANDLADMTLDAAPSLIPLLDAGSPLLVIAGVHAGCYELFAHAGYKESGT